MEGESVEPPKKNFGITLTFILYGVASLLGWNALLTKLDFFSFYLEGMKPSISFSFLNFILNILFQYLLIIKKDLFPLKLQLIGGIVGSIFFLLAIPTSTMFLEKDSIINYIVTGGLVFLMGFINGLAEKYLIIRAWIFFGSSILILVICLILLFCNYNSEFCKFYLSKATEKSDIPEGSLVRDSQLNEEEQGIINDQENKIEDDKNTNENNLTGCSAFIVIFKKIWDLNLIMIYIYIVTFALFPNASIGQNLFDLERYNVITIITIYNVFDTVGRYLVNIMPKTKLFNNIICLGRSILLFTLVFNWYCRDVLEIDLTITSILLILNVAILALTNGIGTTLCFGIAPNLVDNEYKGLAGTALSLFLIIGIFLGSCVGFGVDAIIGLFKKDQN